MKWKWVRPARPAASQPAIKQPADPPASWRGSQLPAAPGHFLETPETTINRTLPYVHLELKNDAYHFEMTLLFAKVFGGRWGDGDQADERRVAWAYSEARRLLDAKRGA